MSIAMGEPDKILFQQSFQLTSADEAFIAAGRTCVADWVAKTGRTSLEPLVLLTSEWLTNLYKHSQQRPKTVGVQLARQDRDWCLSICDDGSGFVEFDSFWVQADTEFDQLKISGMGLGLIKSLSDRVEYGFADSEQAWVFKIFIQDTLPQQPKRIVVIDDDPSLLIQIEAFLQPDYEPVVFSQPLKALEWLTHHSADLVISDVNMPELDGFNLRVRVHQLQGALPFVFLTGESPDALYHLPIDDVLQKPVNKKQLTSCIERVLLHHEQLSRVIGEQLSSDITRQLAPALRIQQPGFRLLLESRSSGEAKGGGGDFVFQDQQHVEGEQHSLILLADVMGHDAQARFFVHVYHGFLHGLTQGMQQLGLNIKPDRLLGSMAQGLEQDELMGSSLLTAIALKLETNGRVTLASAGHPAAKQLTAAGWVDLQYSNGPLLGFIAGQSGSPFTNTAIQLATPMVLYTDGLTDSLSPGQQVQFWGLLERDLRAIQNSNEPHGSGKLAAMDYYDNCVSKQASDDATLLVVIPDTV
ncbi:SpoIIE family protein phosphatase [Bacterioplanoides sp. SCSIO 12839]|uniref:SpoIIE family protein phosphatase n=1 Tax=Bacterioplanoides sp. SCSIO 12839 TaxID=2829569 RepID=UPI0021083A5F|nr:SpoIIE family protein phosphatase [Bacterioplanoides sp. SCSIO 12839]UTW46879.1 SpoIIE family protein phosphatase [Bacterioplanoides sp. SCSIO 12839]